MNIAMNHELRYIVDFCVMPTLIHNGQCELIDFLLKGENAAFCALYNDAWSTYASGKPFYAMDFRCRHIRKGNDAMLYVPLPNAPKTAPMACTHMAVTYQERQGKYENVRLFHLERSNRGTTAIGEMQVGDMGVQAHLNYGSIEKNEEQNINRIWRFAFFDKIPRVPLPVRA